MATQTTFLLKLKSTIDMLGVDIASKLEMTEFLDIDDRESYTSKVIESKNDSVVWRIINYDPLDHSNLFKLLFIVGVSVHADTNNSKALQSAGVIGNAFKKGCTLPVYDYTVAPSASLVKVGFMSIVSNGVDESIQTDIAGFRWLTVKAIVGVNP